jgi:hypothetical protein
MSSCDALLARTGSVRGAVRYGPGGPALSPSPSKRNRKLGMNFGRQLFHFQQFFSGVIDEKVCVCSSALSYGKDAEYCSNIFRVLRSNASSSATVQQCGKNAAICIVRLVLQRRQSTPRLSRTRTENDDFCFFFTGADLNCESAYRTEINLFAVETDASAAGDMDGLVMERINEFRQAAIGTGPRWS